MKIKIVSAEQEANFIRHARTETLKSIGEEVTPQAIEPTPFGMYFITYDGDRPVGMAEIAFHDQVYRSYEESPYPTSLNLAQFCSLSQMAGIRTIYVDPEYRHKAGSLYLQMILAGGQAVTQLGARFGTATTAATDTYLNRLYTKTGGKRMDLIQRDDEGQPAIALFVFNLADLMNHKLIQRVAPNTDIEIDPDTLQIIRARNLWGEERQCA